MPPVVTCPEDGATSSVACKGETSARRNQSSKVDPTPTSLRTPMCPPLCCTMPYTVARPSPVPLPGSLVVKNGSKMCACTSSVHAACRCRSPRACT